ncbi:unnamed protein product, partial [Ascophyllum nodosum]
MFGTTMERQVSDDGVNKVSGVQREGAHGRGKLGCIRKGSTASVPAMSSAEVGAAACSLWCTVALGYLVEGRPIEPVEVYTNRAREAL